MTEHEALPEYPNADEFMSDASDTVNPVLPADWKETEYHAAMAENRKPSRWTDGQWAQCCSDMYVNTGKPWPALPTSPPGVIPPGSAAPSPGWPDASATNAVRAEAELAACSERRDSLFSDREAQLQRALRAEAVVEALLADQRSLDPEMTRYKLRKALEAYNAKEGQ